MRSGSDRAAAEWSLQAVAALVWRGGEAGAAGTVEAAEGLRGGCDRDKLSLERAERSKSY